MTNSTPPAAQPTAQNRDLVLTDEDLAEARRLLDKSPRGPLEDAALPTFTIRSIAELFRSRTALRQVRAAIEGRTSVNVSVILSALGEQE